MNHLIDWLQLITNSHLVFRTCDCMTKTYFSLFFTVSVSVMKACCTYGQSHGAKGRSYTCKESEAVLPGILPYEKNICKSVWSSCCLNQKKSGICREGIRKAM